MTDRKTELLAAIRATDDDHAKLVYADWLEDNDDVPRANLIRLQCRAEKLSPWELDAQLARWEIEQILADHGARFRAELPQIEGVTWTELAKGFPRSVKVANVQALFDHHEAIAEVAPVTRVELDTLDERTTTLPEGGIPWLRTLRLRVDGSAHRPDPHRSLLSIVRELELHNISYDCALLEERDASAPLERVTLEGAHTAAAAIARRIIAMPGARELRSLTLGTRFVDYDSGYYEDPTLRGEGATELALAEFAALEVLDISRQRVGSDGLEALIESFPKLRDVAARGCEIDHLGFLARSTGAPFVRLELGANPLGDRGVTAIVTAPRAAALEALSLDATELYSGGVTAIVDAPCWQTLRTLDLARNPFGVAGALSLAGATTPAKLHTLKLANCDLGPEASRIVGEIPWLAQLVSVDLSRNLIDPVAVAALGSVRELTLSYVPGVGLVSALAPLWPHLVRVDLSGTLGVELPAEAAELYSLVLDDCELSAAALERLATGRFPRLRRLSLANNALDKAALVRFLRSPIIAQLDYLSLAKCGLLDAEVAQVIAATAWPRIERLDLRDEAMTPAALVAIARSETLKRVPSLWLTGRPWDFPEAERQELATRFGEYWYYQRPGADPVDEDEDDAEDEDEDDADAD